MARSTRFRAAMAAALGGLGLLVSCGSEPVRMLHERARFEGTLTVERGGRRLQGELVFDRGNGNLQFTRRGKTTLVLKRNPNGRVDAFENGASRPPTQAEEQDFAWVAAVVEGQGVRDSRRATDGYSVLLDLAATRGWTTVHFVEAPAKRHGH